MSNSSTFSGPNALWVAREWPTVMLMGILTGILGIVILAWPSETLTVLAVILGIQLIVMGLYRLISAFSSETVHPGLTGFVGLVGLVAGIVVVRNPFETVTVLAVVLGVVWIVGGAIDVITAIADSTADHRGWLAVGGLLTLAAGIVVVAWPAPTVTVIAWISGLYLLIFGIFIVMNAFVMRSTAKAAA